MAIRERVIPSNGQIEFMQTHCSHARFVWNKALEQRNTIEADDSLQRLTPYGQKLHLKTWRAEDEWLKKGASVVQQQAILDLGQAFKNWMGNKDHFGRPTWRKRGLNEGFYVRDNVVRRINRKYGEIKIPKCGWVKFRITRPWADIKNAKSARVTQDRSGRWFVSFVAGQPLVRKTSTGKSVGVDMGIAHTITTSDGLQSSPKELRPKEQEHLLRLQRKMARQVKGSKARERTRRSIAVIKAREADRRKDWREKITTQIVQGYDFIGVEDLGVKSMMASANGTIEEPGTGVAQKRGLNRSISKQGWAAARTRLEQKAQAAEVGTIVQEINPAYTSIDCNACKHRDKANRKNQADFKCVSGCYRGTQNFQSLGRRTSNHHIVPTNIAFIINKQDHGQTIASASKNVKKCSLRQK